MEQVDGCSLLGPRQQIGKKEVNLYWPYTLLELKNLYFRPPVRNFIHISCLLL